MNTINQMENGEHLYDMVEGRQYTGIQKKIRDRKRAIKDSYCFEIIKGKFKCIVTLLLIIILALEIFKATIPSLPIEEQREISQNMIKAAKNFARVIKKHFNMTSSENRTQDLLITTTTEATIDDIIAMFNITDSPEYG